VKRKPGADARAIGELQRNHQQEELQEAFRALLVMPLMAPSHPCFSAVRRNADVLQGWFNREAGWPLYSDREGVRLHKRPGSLEDDTRGFKDFSKQTYVLFSLACAVLERTDLQVTLVVLGTELLRLAAEPELASRGFTFTLQSQHERRELVTVCKKLMELGVLERVVGDEEAFIHASSEGADALYDIHRRLLAGVIAAARGPSTWPTEALPISFDERLNALVEEHVPDSDEGRRTAMRHMLTRRLLDDPVVYFDDLDEAPRTYFVNQRGPLAARLCEISGLVPEQRAEGCALVDEDGAVTDISMPSEGTDAHVTLLVAEFLCQAARADSSNEVQRGVPLADVAAFIASARERFGRLWRRAAREPGSEDELASMAVGRLAMLRLLRLSGAEVMPMPALARFSLGAPQVLQAGERTAASTKSSEN